MGLARSDLNENRNIPPDIQQGVEFDGRLGLAKTGPGKEGQAEINGRRIEGVHRLIQFDSQGIVDIQRASLGNEPLRKIGLDPPIAVLVGFGQGGARHSAPDSHVIEFAWHGTQTDFDISQTFPVCQLGKRHAEILIHAGKRFDFVVTLIAIDASPKFGSRQEVHDL